MNRVRTIHIVVAAIGTGLGACVLPNPEFDQDDSDVGHGHDTDTVGDGDGDGGGDGDGDSADGDGDEPGDGDGDGDTDGGDGDGDGDGGDGDGGDGDGDGDEPGDGDGDPAAGTCMGTCGSPGCLACPATTLVDGGGFVIAATETSNFQYGQFLAEKFAPGHVAAWLPEACGWKSDFVPNGWVDSLAAERPVVGVDWCDAWAYCAWSGLRLCGNMNGGPAALADVENATSNQWYRACTNEGLTDYPYGAGYENLTCNGLDAGIGSASDVGSLASCEGGVAGLFDMSGNVWEWTDACDDGGVGPPAQHSCRRRGGSWFSDGPTLRCGINSVRARAFRNTSVGVRCCGD